MKSAETLTSDGWKMFGPGLPIGVERHCLVLFDESNVILIGGTTKEAKYSGQTHIFNFDLQTWKAGPDLKIPRSYQTCGMIRKNSESNEVITFHIIF